VRPTQVGHLSAGFAFLDDRHDLLIAEFGSFSSVLLTEDPHDTRNDSEEPGQATQFPETLGGETSAVGLFSRKESASAE
jgi:hypothetical protein